MNHDPIAVLLIEGDPAAARLVEGMLADARRPAFRMVMAANLTEGLQCLAEKPFDVVLLDLALPDSHGLDTLRRLRQQFPQVPVVTLTPDHDDPDSPQAIREGAQDYLIKDQLDGELLTHSLRYAIERNSIERALHDGDERFRATFDQVSVGMAHVDLDGKFIRVNQKLCDIVGYSREDLLQKTFADITHPDDLAESLEYFRRLRSGEADHYSLEKRYIRKPGAPIWVNVTVSMARNALGRPAYFIGMVEDITFRRKAHESLQFLAALVEGSEDAIIGKTLEGIIQSWNRGAEMVYGYSADEMIGRSITVIYPPGYEAEFYDILERVGRGEAIPRLETKRLRKDGQFIDVALTLSPIRDMKGEKVIGVSSIERDITQRKHDEDRLRYHALLLQNISDAVISTDFHFRIQSWNKAAEIIYGWKAEEVIGRSVSEVLQTKITAEQREVMLQTMLNAGSWNGEVVQRKKNGVLVDIFASTNLIIDREGRPAGFVSVNRDITERKRIENAEREQRILAEALRDTAMALNSTIHLSEVWDRILVNIERVVPYDSADIMLVESSEARVAHSRGYTSDSATIAQLRLPVERTAHLYYMNQTRQPLVISDINAYPDDIKVELALDQTWRSYVGVPIILHNQVIGFISLGMARPHSYTPIHADRLQAFAEQAAIAIQNRQAREHEQALAAFQERQRLARDLHDAVSQTLFSASVTAEAMIRQWERDPSKVPQRLIQLHQLTRGALAEMRALLMELRPTTLLSVDLADLLNQLAEAIQARKVIKIDIHVDEQIVLSQDVKVAVYRIAQEALNNIAKHANATEAALRLERIGSQLRMVIVDNGRGFNPDEVAPTSMGLSIMRERAKMLGAALSIVSQPDAGTQITLVWGDTYSEAQRA